MQVNTCITGYVVLVEQGVALRETLLARRLVQCCPLVSYVAYASITDADR